MKNSTVSDAEKRAVTGTETDEEREKQRRPLAERPQARDGTLARIDATKFKEEG